MTWEGKTIAKVRQFDLGEVQSDLDYPDLDYPDFSIIWTFSQVPIRSWIFLSHDEVP